MSLPRVELKTKELPQEQVAFTALYSGWIPAFMG
ncbi:Uncharacterised protein [Vibrio cholerae]|nr:Uncharacterised protein [Vibrio cholerae]